MKKIARHNGKRFDDRKLNKAIALFFLLSLWLVATLNPSILGMIESLGGPIIAMILFIMPMYAIHKIPALAKFRGKVSNIFVTVMGLVAISGLIASFF